MFDSILERVGSPNTAPTPVAMPKLLAWHQVTGEDSMVVKLRARDIEHRDDAPVEA